MGNCCGLCPEEKKTAEHKLKDPNTKPIQNQSQKTESETQNQTQNVSSNQKQNQSSTENETKNPSVAPNQIPSDLKSQTVDNNNKSKAVVPIKHSAPAVTYKGNPNQYKTAPREVLAAAAERRLAQQKAKPGLKSTNADLPGPPNAQQSGLRWTVG